MVNFFVILRKIQNPIRVCSGIASTGPSGSDTQFRGEGVGVADPRLNHWLRPEILAIDFSADGSIPSKGKLSTEILDGSKDFDTERP